MLNLLELIIIFGIIELEIFGVIFIALLIQGLVYRLSNKKINLYKILNKNL